MVGIYFSGTGNSKYCVERFCLECNKKAITVSIEDKNVIDLIKGHQVFVIGYPVYYSNVPPILKDFIEENKSIWKNKKIIVIATMALFSGDGAGCGARLLKEKGGTIIGGLHVKMPDDIADVRILKKSFEKNQLIIQHANHKIKKVAKKFKMNKATTQGLNYINRILGLLGQRLWFANFQKYDSHKLKVNVEQCIGCGKCAKLCPMNNIMIKDDKAIARETCTKCYRCIANCPVKALTLLGEKVVKQYKIEDYIL